MARTGQKALSYLRVSGQGQIGGDGFPRQREAVERYAKLHGLEVLQEFRDEGVSGTKELEGRVGLAAVMDRLLEGGVEVVLVERSDRLARDLLVGEVILGRFRDLGVKVVAAESGTELTVGDNDPTRKLIRQVLGAVAEYDKAVTVLKLRAARDRKRRSTGRCEGRLPYADDVIELIRKLSRKPRGGQRPSCAEVASELNQRGIPTKSGRPWSRGTVWNLLKRTRDA